MKRIFVVLIVLFSIRACRCTREYHPKNGDIIFQTSRSSQSLAIQKATKSPYSHMGIIYLKQKEPFVFEAAKTVKLTPLRNWIARGVDGHFVVKRLVNKKEFLDPDALKQMKRIGETFKGKPYDPYFEWSDDRIYCSELVWKIYKRGLGLDIGKRQTMSEFDLSDPLVQAKVRERFGDSLPKDETVISPAAIFASKRLVTVYKE